MSIADISEDRFGGPLESRGPERTPPHDLLAEQSTLGGMLLSSDAVADVIEALRGTDFYVPKHELIFEAILTLYSHGEPTDVVAVTDELIKTGEHFELGAVLTPDPRETFINEGRQFNIYTKNNRPLPNARVINEELVITELGQIGTQLDAFAHQMWGESFYNCNKLGEIGGRNGFSKLGVEQVGALMTRGLTARLMPV